MFHINWKEKSGLYLAFINIEKIQNADSYIIRYIHFCPTLCIQGTKKKSVLHKIFQFQFITKKDAWIRQFNLVIYFLIVICLKSFFKQSPF